MDHQVVLVSCEEHMQQSGVSSEPDDRLLMAALAARGVTVRSASWADPSVDWAASRLCIIRSAWDYHHHLADFLRWSEQVAAVTTLRNTVPILRWNTRKTYLRDLERLGIPIIPTVWLEAGATVDLAALLAERGWPRAVVKPMISTNAYATRLLSRSMLAEGQAQLDALLASRDVMIQPFMTTTAGYGERSMVFINGVLTHAFRKRSALVGHEDPFGEIPVTPSLREARLARTVLERAAELIQWDGAPPGFLFARVDLLQDSAGSPRLMELELVEPRLRLADAPWALARLLQVIERGCTSSLRADRMVAV